MILQRNASLRPFNTFGIDQKAEVLARFGSAAELKALLASPELQGMPRLILGGGSNVLFTRDYPGAVLLNEVKGITLVREDDEHVWVKAGAGETWHALVLHAVANGWGGIENMSLIPGKVGAGPMQNIGAYGVELKDVFDELEAFHVEDGTVHRFDRVACAFGYRESFFKRAGKDRFVILSVTVRLRKHPKVNTTYGSIKHELEKRGIAHPTIKDVSDAVIAIRRSKLPDPTELGNAGSFFKNPVVPAELAERIKAHTPDLVTYPGGDGAVKLAAGQLIEKAGWKGFREGAVGVHRDQALVLVNHGGATGAMIFDLSERIFASVRDRFGVELEREVNII
jgi:UDP-N-acetylmuramate dehydrogenase